MAASPIDSTRRNALERLYAEAGSVSPSIATIEDVIPGTRVDVDACFLGNPYAMNLFVECLHRDVLDDPTALRAVLGLYPSQNRHIAGKLANHIGVPAETVFVGNGATEVIQAVLHNFAGRLVLVNLPTLSCYYEFVSGRTEVAFHRLDKDRDFVLDVEEYLTVVRRTRPDTVVLVNPNNPDGGYLSPPVIQRLLAELAGTPTVILDESFIDFVDETGDGAPPSTVSLTQQYPNLVVINSMSKNFGVAGLRAGYALLAPERVATLLETGYLWNVNGLTEYFFDLYVEPEFQRRYRQVLNTYLAEFRSFEASLASLTEFRAYPTRANFVLLEVLDGRRSTDLAARLLFDHGVYVRACFNKRGLPGEFLRIGPKTARENELIRQALRSVG